MITRFRVRNYKALRDVTLDLTPIHVLIGPNDSGKTSILEARRRAMSKCGSSAFQSIHRTLERP
jgi:AAA15 family ATPase/GTPase